MRTGTHKINYPYKYKYICYQMLFSGKSIYAGTHSHRKGQPKTTLSAIIHVMQKKINKICFLFKEGIGAQ